MGSYYNELDPFAAEWLRELIRAGLLPQGDVDARSIVDVEPGDLRGYEQCHFFAGIGGWPYALGLAGWTGACWTGSCPCQPFSAAGKGDGAADERHLWPAWFALIRECRPEYIFGEQVSAAIRLGWLDGVFTDLELEGYTTGAAVLGAHSVGAPHIRQRLYWVAQSNGIEQHRSGRTRGGRSEPANGSETDRLADSNGGRREQRDAGLRGVSEPYADGTTSGLAESGNIGRGSLLGDVRKGQSDTEWGGAIGGLADTERNGGRADLALGGQEGRDADGRAGEGAHGLGDTDDAGPQGRYKRGDCAGERTPWTPSVVIECGDGKHRRIPAEPALFPLAPGLSAGRVGILRGAGNAIVPALAAEFVMAFGGSGDSDHE
jgi:DNA (cytosine-5)-methyltransferase 1